MKNKIIATVLTIIILIASTVSVFAISENDKYITSYNTPRTSAGSELLWSRKFGSSYKDSPSTITVVDKTLLVMSQKYLYKINSTNGKTIKRVSMVDIPSFSYTAPTYADGIVFCPLDNGTVQAFDYKTLKSLWVYKDSLGGQSLSTIKYSNGCIYTGFWNDEDQYANYVCIDVKDENKFSGRETKSAKWTYKSLGGFYWTGCVFSGNSVIVGTDDGTLYANKNSKLLSLDKVTGKVVDSMTITGDQRSEINLIGNNAYFVTKAGYLYNVIINNGKFDTSSVKRLSLGEASTSTPVVYKNRLYVGVQGSKPSEGYIKVINTNTMTVIYSAPAKGYPQNNILLCNAYEKETGKVFVYSTYNSPPGGITVYTDSAAQTSAQKSELYSPGSEQSAYCVSNIVCDENGTLFYKNDSGYVFAICNGTVKKDSSIKQFFSNIVNFFRNIFK